eukprot:scaffold122431_cov30-Tisochrysis_lutea.AAC.5
MRRRGSSQPSGMYCLSPRPAVYAQSGDRQGQQRADGHPSPPRRHRDAAAVAVPSPFRHTRRRTATLYEEIPG